MAIIEINNRYSNLAIDACCLSCGGARDYSEPQTGEVCLDLGSGRGTDVLAMAQRVKKDGFAYGIDIADGMLAKADRTAKKMGIDNVRFIKSELESIPLKSGSVDLIISNCTINHAKNKQMVWDEIYRLLKNDGRFVVSDIYSLEEVPGEYKNNPQAIAECWAGAVTRSEYIRQIKSAGFSQFDILEESEPYSKGAIKVSSITIRAFKKKQCCK